MNSADTLYYGFDRDALEREYDARASVPSFDDEYAHYLAASRAARTHLTQASIVFDGVSGETLDFYAAQPGGPVFLWVHGGYWRSSSKEDNAFVAAGLLPHGISVAVMDYTLAPSAGLDEIVRQTRAAVAFLHHRGTELGIASGPIGVGGSSAGGHLVGMLLAEGWQKAHGIPDALVGHALSLSGLYDLEPLRYTAPNAWLRLDEATARRNSPLYHIPKRSGARLIASVGGMETREFQRQTTAYTAAWQAAEHHCEIVPMPEFNHYDIALSLRDPAGPLAQAVAVSMSRSA